MLGLSIRKKLIYCGPGFLTESLKNMISTQRTFYLSVAKNKSDASIREEKCGHCEVKSSSNPYLISADAESLVDLEAGLTLIPAFITEAEEEALFGEVNPYLRRLRYEANHWDDAIHDYRETEKPNWNDKNSLVIERLKRVAFGHGSTTPLSHVHVLDVSEKGYIKPHIDAVRFCGNTVAGISLLTDSVMRFVHESQPSRRASLLLPRRSLYVMRDEARFRYTHEILRSEESTFGGQQIPKGRRISIICRNAPLAED